MRRQKGNRERGRGAQAAPQGARRMARISQRKPPVLRVLGTPQTCPLVLGGEKANPRITAASHPKIRAAFREKSSRCEQKSLALRDSVPAGRVQQGGCCRCPPGHRARPEPRNSSPFRTPPVLPSRTVISGPSLPFLWGCYFIRQILPCPGGAQPELPPRHRPQRCSTGLCAAPQPPAVPTRGQRPHKGADVSPELLRQWGRQPRAPRSWRCPRPHTRGPPTASPPSAPPSPDAAGR